MEIIMNTRKLKTVGQVKTFLSGVLSQRARKKEFQTLTQTECEYIEYVYASIFNNS
jgi:hypothetical protein